MAMTSYNRSISPPLADHCGHQGRLVRSSSRHALHLIAVATIFGRHRSYDACAKPRTRSHRSSARPSCGIQKHRRTTLSSHFRIPCVKCDQRFLAQLKAFEQFDFGLADAQQDAPSCATRINVPAIKLPSRLTRASRYGYTIRQDEMARHVIMGFELKPNKKSRIPVATARLKTLPPRSSLQPKAKSRLPRPIRPLSTLSEMAKGFSRPSGKAMKASASRLYGSTIASMSRAKETAKKLGDRMIFKMEAASDSRRGQGKPQVRASSPPNVNGVHVAERTYVPTNRAVLKRIIVESAAPSDPCHNLMPEISRDLDPDHDSESTGAGGNTATSPDSPGELESGSSVMSGGAGRSDIASNSTQASSRQGNNHVLSTQQLGDRVNLPELPSYAASLRSHRPLAALFRAQDNGYFEAMPHTTAQILHTLAVRVRGLRLEAPGLYDRMVHPMILLGDLRGRLNLISGFRARHARAVEETEIRILRIVRDIRVLVQGMEVVAREGGLDW